MRKQKQVPAITKRSGSEPPRLEMQNKQQKSMILSSNCSQNDFRQVVKDLTQIEDLLEAKLFDLREVKDFVSTVSVHSSLEFKQSKKVIQIPDAELNDQNQRISSSKKNKFIVKYSDGKIQELNIENYLVCLVCLEPMQKPATLPCGHTFCSICIQKSSQQWSPKRCPLCKQEFSRFPNINMVMEQQIFTKLKLSQQALQGDLVQVLVTENRIQAFTFGIVERIFDGFVGQDMATLVDHQLIGDEQNGFFPTKIALVNTGMRHWTGKISDVRVCKPHQYVLGTRLIRGSLLVHQKNIQIHTDTQYVSCDLQTYNKEKKLINKDRATPINFNSHQENKQNFQKPPIKQKQTAQQPQIAKNPQTQPQNSTKIEAQKQDQANIQKLPQLTKPSKFAQFRQQQLEKMKQQKNNQDESIAVDIFIPNKQQQDPQKETFSQKSIVKNQKSQLKSSPSNKSPELQKDLSPIASKGLQSSPQLTKAPENIPQPNDVLRHENQTPNILKSENNDLRQENELDQTSLMQTLPNRSLIVQINQRSYMNSIKPFQDPKPKQVQQIQKISNSQQSIPTEQNSQLKQKLVNNANKLLKEDFIYDPEIPKQQPPIFTPYSVKDPEQVSILLFDEVISDQHTLFSTAMNKYETQQLTQYLRLVTDFADFSKYPHFCCNGCKQLLRLPVSLKCGCQYCYTCAMSLNALDQITKCLGCGALLSKEQIDIQQQIHKQLVMKMYAKIPRHTPQIDKGIPVRCMVDGKIGILLDDPERINVWVMFGPKQVKYLHIHEIQAINMCGLQLALRITEGLAYYKGKFVFLKADREHMDIDMTEQQESQLTISASWQIYDLDNYNGYQLSATDTFYYQCFRPVEDIRQSLVAAKQEGKRIQAKFQDGLKQELEKQCLNKEHDIKVKQQQEIDKQLNEIAKEEPLESKQPKQQSKFANIKSSYAQEAAPQTKPKDLIKLAKIKEAQKQQMMEKEIKERQKKLGLKPFKQEDLVDLRNLNAENVQADKKKIEKYAQLQQKLQQQNTQNLSPLERYYQSNDFKSKSPLVQLCYKYPDFNFLCSACWNILKRPITLKCGHIVCRTCACIYQASSQKCLLCKEQTGEVLDLELDKILQEQMFMIDELYTDRQLDIGCFVYSKDDEQELLGIITNCVSTKGKKLLMVTYGDNDDNKQKIMEKLFEPKSLKQLQVVSIFDGNEIGVGSPVMVHTGHLRGIMGLVVRASPNQQSLLARRLRYQYQTSDQSLILHVVLETGYPIALPIDILRKVQLQPLEHDYEHFQGQLSEKKEKETNLLKEQVKNYIGNLTSEERNALMKKYFQNNVTPEQEVRNYKNIWEKKK